MTTKTIFFSHASADREVVQVFEDYLFGKNKLDNLGYKLVFTSSNDFEKLLAGGVDIWKKITEALHSTVYFCAFLSESYLESPWSIAELTLFTEICKGRENLPEPVLMVIDNSPDDYFDRNPLTTGLRLGTTNRYDISRIVSGFNIEHIPVKHPINYDGFAKDVNNAKSECEKRKKGTFFELAKHHFSRPDTSNCPLSFLVERDEYVQTAINMGKASKKNLLWTVFQSPLLVEEAYSHRGCLMPYDLEFEKFSIPNKIRLVIFRDPKEAQAYKNVDHKSHNTELVSQGAKSISKKRMEQRKQAFENSVKRGGAKLLFTNAELLNNLISGQITPFNDHSFLEFAYGDCGLSGTNLLMETGFSSPFARKHAPGQAHNDTTFYNHITFYIEPVTEVTKRINEIPAYRDYYGHLSASWKIAKEAFQTPPKRTIFFESNQISKLCK